jgi:pimeloyl-ACP methyl ester carboxylesterase
VGRVVAELDKKGIRDNTLIVFQSDNGGTRNAKFAGEGDMSKVIIPCDNGPYREGKGSLYEGGTRVCALANWPGHIKSGITGDGMIHVVDMYPTIASLAGASTAKCLPFDGLNVWGTISEIDYVILEASGVADPEGIVMTFLDQRYERRRRLDSITCLVDAEAIFADGDNEALNMLKLRQIGFADLVVLNKIDLFSLSRIYYGVTAIARFDGRRCVLSFEDPLAVETVQLDGHSYALAADFTVPLAVMLASTDPKKYELARLLNPAKYAETARISRLQPYDPNKTVVLVIHGLMDSPATWTPMLNRLRGDGDIRRNYQFWFYSYPSGYPYPYSASILRHELDGIEKRFPLRKKMVVIGHGMGGCISRLLITDTDKNFWMKLFNKPPEQVPFSPEGRKILTDALIFKHRPEVGRVIFISAPLRGSDLASNWLGRIGSSLVKAPSTLLGVGDSIIKITTFQSGDLQLKRIPNSVDTLAPNNRFVKAITNQVVTAGSLRQIARKKSAKSFGNSHRIFCTNRPT